MINLIHWPVWGGDEFGILLDETTTEDAMLMAEKMRHTMEDNEICLLDYGSFNITLSIGVVLIDGSLDAQRLFALADTALYSAKDHGRNQVKFIDAKEKITSQYREINWVIAQIKNALKQDNFELYFQPVVDVNNQNILHHEALLRLQGDDNQLILPGQFIPLAEQFGLMPQIDRLVVKNSLHFLQQNPGTNLFINISGISLSDQSLLLDIETMILQSGLNAARIGFEITETSAVKDLALTQNWIKRLKKIGCQFALDDFGKGFSSFTYLRLLPVDYLKIDGTFICNLDSDQTNRAFVAAMNTIALSLGIKTIAEFVDNENILKVLQELEIDCAQGYYFGLPAKETCQKISSTKA